MFANSLETCKSALVQKMPFLLDFGSPSSSTRCQTNIRVSIESLATAEKRKRTRNVSVIFRVGIGWDREYSGGISPRYFDAVGRPLPLIRMAPPLSKAHKRRHSPSDRQLGKFDRKSRAFNGSKNMTKEISFSVWSVPWSGFVIGPKKETVLQGRNRGHGIQGWIA